MFRKPPHSSGTMFPLHHTAEVVNTVFLSPHEKEKRFRHFQKVRALEEYPKERACHTPSLVVGGFWESKTPKSASFRPIPFLLDETQKKWDRPHMHMKAHTLSCAVVCLFVFRITKNSQRIPFAQRQKECAAIVFFAYILLLLFIPQTLTCGS